MKFSLSEPTSFVTLIFGKEATDTIQLMKERLSKYYEVTAARSRPHFTLTDWTGPRDSLYFKLSYFSETQIQFPFRFWSVGSFTNGGVVYLEPQDDRYFRNLQYNVVRAIGNPSKEFLNPGLWNPHCTVVKGLKAGMLKHAELSVTSEFQVMDTTALGMQIITKGHDPLFVEFTGC